MRTESVGFYCVHHFSIVKNTKDNNNTTANRSQLHTRLLYNFYWAFINSIAIHYK